LTNIFDPHIYACQSLSGSNSNPTIQSVSNETHQKPPQSPMSSPQKNKHVNSNTVIPIQSSTNSGTATPTRKSSQVDDPSTQFELENPNLNNSSGNSTNSGEVSRKTSTETTQVTEVGVDDVKQHVDEVTPLPLTPLSSLENNATISSPVRKLSRFLVSPTIVENANNELMVQETSQTTVQSPQQSDTTSIEMNINEENFQRLDNLETELQPQQSTGFRMPETLEQLKKELENITHAHVSTKSKEPISTQPSMSTGLPLDNDDSHEPISEAHVESSTADVPSIHDAIGSLATGDNTSVYNSRRTSADMNTNPTDLTSTASGILDNDENLVSESMQEDISNAGKLSLNIGGLEK
jgi:hypothetical protein